MNKKLLSEWWTRPCGGRAVLVLALPLVASMASWTVMNFTDRMFLLWYATPAMAAALPAGMLHFTLLCLPLGIASYVNTFVAQYYGAGRIDRIGLAVGQGVWLGLAVTPLFVATIPLAPTLFALAGHAPELAGLETTYYQISTLGGGAMVISAALSSFFTGRSATRVVMLVDMLAALLNVVLDYAWIFGHWGFPRMGIAGAAWATTVSLWFGVGLYLLFMLRASRREGVSLDGVLRFDRVLMTRLLRYGGPNGLQLLVEVAAFSIFVLLVGRLGEGAMAATTLAFNVNSLVFVPMLGLGVAVSTMVGQQLGRNRDDLAQRATWTSFWIAMAYTGAFGLLYVSVPDLFLIGHAAGTSPEEFARLRPVVVVLLRFVAAYCLLDSMNVIFASAIKGAGDTRFVLLTALLTAPLPVLGAWAGITWWDYGLIWCWGVMTLWAWTLGVVYLARFLQGRWRTMRVIEPNILVEREPEEDEAVEAPASTLSGA